MIITQFGFLEQEKFRTMIMEQLAALLVCWVMMEIAIMFNETKSGPNVKVIFPNKL